jgi:hypothetical protein
MASSDSSHSSLPVDESFLSLPATGHLPALFSGMDGGSYELEEQRKRMVQIVREAIRQRRETTGPSSSSPSAPPHPAPRIMEIGFNGGHSAELFLRNFPDAQVVSFDLGSHPYVPLAKQLIDKHYPGRHTLILGDSAKTVPSYAGEPFDAIFIDGGHELEEAAADLRNCARLCGERGNPGVVLMDDCYDGPGQASWNDGPTRGWKEAVASGLVLEKGGEVFTTSRGMRWGSYWP